MQETQKWAKNVLEKPDKYLILDTETTGFTQHDAIVQIAIMDILGKPLIDTLIRPSKKGYIPQRATDIHGIDFDMVRTQPKMKDIRAQIQAIFQNKIVLIYNAPFDTRMLAQSLARDGADPLIFEFECVMNKYREHIRSYNNPKLPRGRHTAISDCEAVLQLIKEMAEGEIFIPSTKSESQEPTFVQEQRQIHRHPVQRSCWEVLGFILLALIGLNIIKEIIKIYILN